MTRDKQLSNVPLDRVLEKRRLDQALNTKEFAVLAGISYSAARTWFRQPGFPVFRGFVFWQDFVQWRNAKTAFQHTGETDPARPDCDRSAATKPPLRFTGKAAQILAEAG